MKVLRRLPDDVGEPIEVVTKYKKGNVNYIVSTTSGGRMIYSYEDEQVQVRGGQEAREVVGVFDVPHEEEIHQHGQSQEGGTNDSQVQGERQATAPVPMSSMQGVSLINGEVGSV